MTMMLRCAVLFGVLSVCLGSRLPFIINGDDVDPPGKYPWQASIQLLGAHNCGAALISQEWLVTAAHCVMILPSLLTVVVGMHDQYTMEQGDPRRYGTAQIIQHPDFDLDANRGFPNDIALIRLEEAAPENEFIRPVTLAAADADFDDANCIITGWGYFQRIAGIPVPVPPNILQEANTVVIPNQPTCRDLWIEAGENVLNDGHICVYQGVTGACSGDSGGPLVCPGEDGSLTLAGVTSWGESTCNTAYPSVYTRISYFRDWIRDNSGI